ncbi:MAG: PorT family protein [Bacteroidales bacterium]|nr:PorT family protein [Bacteroidales bacterium]
MKKKIIISLLLTILAFLPVSAKTFSFGVKGGVTLSTLSFKGDFTDNFSSKNRAGFFIGPMLNAKLPLGFNIDAAVMYARETVNYDNEQGGVSDNRNLIDVPLNLKWQVSLANVIGIYLSAGPDFSFNLGDIDNIENFIKGTLDEQGVDSSTLESQTKKLSMGVGVGAGIVLFDHLNIGFNYIFPLDYTYKYVLDDMGLEFSSKAKRWQISAAYIF